MIIKRFQWVVGAIAALICVVTLSVAALDNDASAKPPAKSKTAAAWKVGDKVSAVWPTDGKWYNAQILEVYDTGLYHVRYDDPVTSDGSLVVFMA